MDSDMYRIEKRLVEHGFIRGQGETLHALIMRVEGSGMDDLGVERLKTILKLHNKLRFHPLGLSGGERSELKKSVDFWLSEISRQGLFRGGGV